MNRTCLIFVGVLLLALPVVEGAQRFGGFQAAGFGRGQNFFGYPGRGGFFNLDRPFQIFSRNHSHFAGFRRGPGVNRFHRPFLGSTVGLGFEGEAYSMPYWGSPYVGDNDTSAFVDAWREPRPIQPRMISKQARLLREGMTTNEVAQVLGLPITRTRLAGQEIWRYSAYSLVFESSILKGYR